MQRRVPFFDYPAVYHRYASGFESALADVGSRGAFIMQRDLQEFESRLAEYVGAKHAIGVANATDGLQMAMMADGLPPGAEVIICSHTMIATAASIHFAGGTPVPVDAGADHLIDPNAVREAVSDRTRAICPTQLNGRTCDMDALQEIADEHGLRIYEDAAQALGSKFRDRAAGTFGVAGCISFYPAKLLGCLGDGGAVVTNDTGLFERLLMLRDHGRGEDGDVHCWGFNSRLDSLQAAFLNVQFDDYAHVISHRRELAATYWELLGGCPELVLPPAPDSDSRHFDVFQNFEIEAEHRDELQVCLADQGVGTLVQWSGKPVHGFSELGFCQALPRTDKLFKRLLMLPLNMSVSVEDAQYVSDCILGFYKGR